MRTHVIASIVIVLTATSGAAGQPLEWAGPRSQEMLLPASGIEHPPASNRDLVEAASEAASPESQAFAAAVRQVLQEYKLGESWPRRNFEGLDFLEPLWPRVAVARGDVGRVVLNSALPYSLLTAAFAAERTDQSTLAEITRWDWVGIDQAESNDLSFAITSSDSFGVPGGPPEGLQHGEGCGGGCRRPEVIDQPGTVRQRPEGRRTVGGMACSWIGRGCDPCGSSGGLCGLAEVTVVQAADFCDLHDLADGGKLDRPEVRCVLVEREVGARLMVIGEVTGQDSAQVSFAQDENMVEALAPDRADQALRERVLPGAVRRGEDFADSHGLHAAPELLAIDLVTVAEEIGRGRVVRERGDDLVRGPDSGRVLGDVEVDDPPAMVGKHDEDEQDAQARGGHGEEIDGDQVPDMVREEGPPGLRRLRTPAPRASGLPQLGGVRDQSGHAPGECAEPRSGSPAESAREGVALLQGLVICGRCGERMTVRYIVCQGHPAPYYVCQRAGIATAQRICERLPGGRWMTRSPRPCSPP